MEFSTEVTVVLGMRSQLMCDLAVLIAKELPIAQSCVSDLVRGKRGKFTLDMLVELATRAGCKVSLEMA